jgi:hypothetical protein
VADRVKYQRPTVSLGGGSIEDRPKLRRSLIRWITFGILIIVIFLAAVGLLGGWAASVVNWPQHSGRQEILGYLLGCLAILSIPTVIYSIRSVLDLLQVAKFEDQSLEQRITNMHALLDETADLMDELRQELAARTAALQALTEQKERIRESCNA